MSGGALVLLVEDDADTAALYVAMLSAEGMEVTRRADQKAARLWWEQSKRRPDLVILDVRLPDGTGLDLCRELTAHDGCPPVMVLSAHGDPRMPGLCRQAGAQEFLDKLRDLDRMVDSVRQLISLHGQI